jgi:glycosyltransferase involved in cell wall biosynthesis
MLVDEFNSADPLEIRRISGFVHFFSALLVADLSMGCPSNFSVHLSIARGRRRHLPSSTRAAAAGHYSLPMLRLLSLTSAYPDRERPGAGSFVEHQLRALAARPGVEVEVLAPVGLPLFPLSLSPGYRRDRALPRVEVLNGLTVHRPRFRIPPFGGARRPDAIARALQPVVRALRERFAFDILHAEFFWPDGPAALRIAQALGIPFSVKARGGDFERPATGHDWAQRQVLEAGAQASRLLAVSETLRSAMIGRGLPPERIAVHRTGLDRAHFRLRDRAGAKAALKVAGPLLLNVGNLLPRKRQHLAIETVAKLAEATLILVGGGPDRPALERRARDLGVEGRVRFMGSIPQPLVALLYAAADVTVHTAELEGLSNVWVESLACGTPVVTTDAGAASELIDRPEAGRVIAPDPAAIAAAVRGLLEGPPPPDAVAACVAGYSWERNAEELEAQLRAALRSASA